MRAVALSITDGGCCISKENKKYLIEPLCITKSRILWLDLTIINNGNQEVRIEMENPYTVLRIG